MKKIISRPFVIINGIVARRFKYLLYALILMIFIPGFFNSSLYQQEVSFIFRSAVVLIGIAIIQESAKQLYTGMALGFIVLSINQIGVFKDSATIDFYLSFLIFIFFYSYLAFIQLKMLVKAEKVSTGALFAAVNVYLLIGVIGAFAYMLIENFQPGSLNNLTVLNLKDPSKFIYFSFSTLSTLGYGDITPSSPATQSLSIILSTTGPLYLTILVALLVSRFSSEEPKQK